jgi:PqqD family protein of HPr-rel-A system
MRFRAAEPAALLIRPLDAFVAVFHRPSGITHLLVEPAPQILAALDAPLTLSALAERLAATFDRADDDDALAARVDELVAAGLVEAA